MPRGCQFGYIFTGAITDAAGSGMSKNEIIGRTVAHELGHGTFKLRHTFDSEYRIAKATTDNLMDYSWGRDLVKHQWDAIHAPGLVIGLFEKDEDAMEIIISELFDKEELKKYHEIISELKKIKMFQYIYDYIDKSDQYVSIELFQATLKNYDLLKNRYMKVNGYFENTKTTKEFLFGLISYKSGEKNNPHKIVLFSSKNYKMTNGKIRGNAFKDPATIFEEFFHAAHYLYLKENNLYEDDIRFFTQTETEVEIAQGTLYYLLMTQGRYKNIVSYFFDGYELVREHEKDKMDDTKTKFIEELLSEDNVSSSTVIKYKEQIRTMINNKKAAGAYKDLDFEKIKWSFDFIKKVLKNVEK
jgi:hypothetical protein